jgi:hypothetical protein
VDLAWRAPGSNGGGAISNYIVEYKVDGPSLIWTRFPRVASSATTATVTGLANGTSYLLRVTAVNAAGIGPGNDAGAAIIRGADIFGLDGLHCLISERAARRA